MTGDGTDRERDPGRVPEMFAFVGSQTTGAGEGITILPYDGRTGDFREGRLIHDTGNPTFLEIDAARSMLYAVQEMESFEGSPGGGLATYSLALGRDGAVRATRLCSQSSLGTSPCHVVTEPQRRTLFVSNYRDGVLSVFPLDGHGEPGPAIQEFRYLGHGQRRPSGVRPRALGFHLSGRTVRSDR
jgi:6-phosphogluconolactonase